jgi:FkbM family methyltransferase
MEQTILGRLSQLAPRPIQSWLRDRYWRVKSNLLYSRLYKLLQLEYTLQSGIVLKVASKGEWWTYNDIFVNHEYDFSIQEALKSHSSVHPFTILDLGANVGYFSLRVIDLMRQDSPQGLEADITLVEGSPTNYQELERRLGSQPLSPARTRLIHGLVGLRNGAGTIRESAIHVKNTIIHQPQTQGASVNFVDLVNLMESKSEIDLLKCDIEGAEQLFIENYPELLAKVKNAVFEFHDELCDTACCEAYLKASGFRQEILRSSPGISIRFFSRN